MDNDFLFQAEKVAQGKIDKDVGKLLYNIATKLKAQIKNHQPMLVEYVVARKITTEIQLNGAWHLQNHNSMNKYMHRYI